MNLVEKMKNLQKRCLDSQEIYKDEYKCNKCRDLTFIIEDNTAIPCSCRSLKLSESILEGSQISKAFRSKVFENFDYTISKDIANAYIIAKTYAKNFKEIKNTKNNSLLLMGNPGSGKSHLVIAVANYLMKNQETVFYMSYRESITSIKQSILDTESYNRVMDKYKNVEILIIDDLYKGSITQSDLNIMFEIINTRYLNNKPILVSTEKSAQELLNIDEAIGSRIIEMCKNHSLELKGKSLNYRLR